MCWGFVLFCFGSSRNRQKEDGALLDTVGIGNAQVEAGLRLKYIIKKKVKGKKKKMFGSLFRK